MRTREALELPDVDLHGHYTIEMRDERGKLKDRIETPNYITPLFSKWAAIRALAGLYPYGMPHASGVRYSYDTSVAGVNVRPFYDRPMPMDSVILTNSARDEDLDDSWLTGDTVAFAPFFKMNAAAAGKQGLINEAESLISADRVYKWVWDWTTQQGNGEYQTIAIGSMYFGAQQQIANMGPSILAWESWGNDIPDAAAWGYTNGLSYNPTADKWLVHGHDNANTDDRGKMCVADGNTALMLATEHSHGLTGRSPNLSELTWSAEIQNDRRYKNDSSDGTYTHINDNYPVLALSGAAPQPYLHMYSPATSGRARLGYFNASGVTTGYIDEGYYGTQNLSGTANYGRGTPFYIMELGGYIWAHIGGNNNRTVGRYTYGTTAPVFDAYLPIPAEVQGNIHSICDDGTDFLITTSYGLYRVGQDGSYKGNYGVPLYLVPNESFDGLSPWYEYSGSTSSLYNYWAMHRNGEMMLRGRERFVDLDMATSNSHAYRAGPSVTQFQNTGGADHDVLCWNGTVWKWHTGPGIWGPQMVGVEGGNMFSRALLDSPVTKSSSATMKISYELTIPDPYSFIHDFQQMPSVF